MQVYRVLIVLVLGMCWITPAEAQNTNDRVEALEDYVETFQSTLRDFAITQDKHFDKYMKDVNASLEGYTGGLERDLNEQLEDLDRKRIQIDVGDKAFQSIESNAGLFLISVDQFTAIEEGYRLTLNIGNPNYADYKGFTLRLLWGPKYYPALYQSYDVWRSGLVGAEYSFEGTLRKGSWNQIDLDLNLKSADDLAYLECEMEISSIELQF